MLLKEDKNKDERERKESK